MNSSFLASLLSAEFQQPLFLTMETGVTVDAATSDASTASDGEETASAVEAANKRSVGVQCRLEQGIARMSQAKCVNPFLLCNCNKSWNVACK